MRSFGFDSCLPRLLCVVLVCFSSCSSNSQNSFSPWNWCWNRRAGSFPRTTKVWSENIMARQLQPRISSHTPWNRPSKLFVFLGPMLALISSTRSFVRIQRRRRHMATRCLGVTSLILVNSIAFHKRFPLQRLEGILLHLRTLSQVSFRPGPSHVCLHASFYDLGTSCPRRRGRFWHCCHLVIKRHQARPFCLLRCSVIPFREKRIERLHWWEVRRSAPLALAGHSHCLLLADAS